MSLSLAGSGQITGFDAGLSGFGALVAVSSVTGTPTHSTTSATPSDVGLSVTHTPASASNKLYVVATGLLTNSSTATGFGSYAILVRDSTDLAIASIAGTGEHGGNATLSILDAPATTSAVTYKVQLARSGNTAWWGRWASDATAMVSTIVVMEVEV